MAQRIGISIAKAMAAWRRSSENGSNGMQRRKKAAWRKRHGIGESGSKTACAHGGRQHQKAAAYMTASRNIMAAQKISDIGGDKK